MNKLFMGLLVVLLVSQAGRAAENLELKDQDDKVNYSIGYQIGGDFVSQGVELRDKMIVKGIRDAVEKKQPLLPQQEMNQVLIDLKERIVAKERQQKNEAGQAFLAENRKKEGVVELPVGVQYRELEAGKGPSPTMEDSVVVNFRARTMEGVEVANTYTENKPRTYLIGKMMPGLRDVLLLMQAGDKWEVVVPLGQLNDSGQGILIYDIELVSVKPAAKE